MEFDLVRNADTLFGWQVKLSSGSVLDASPIESALAERTEILQKEIRALKCRITVMKRVKGGRACKSEQNRTGMQAPGN